MRPNVSGPDGSPNGVRTIMRRWISRLASCVRPLPPMMAIISSASFGPAGHPFAQAALIGARRGLALLLPERVDRRQVAPQPIRVHAEAEHIAVGHGDAHEVGVRRLGAADVLV